MSEQILLSDQTHCTYLITQEWLWINKDLKYVGNAEDVARNELLCGFICQAVDGGFKEYGFGGKSKRVVRADASFLSLLKSLNIELNKSWNIYKQIK